MRPYISQASLLSAYNLANLPRLTSNIAQQNKQSRNNTLSQEKSGVQETKSNLSFSLYSSYRKNMQYAPAHNLVYRYQSIRRKTLTNAVKHKDPRSNVLEKNISLIKNIMQNSKSIQHIDSPSIRKKRNLKPIKINKYKMLKPQSITPNQFGGHRDTSLEIRPCIPENVTPSPQTKLVLPVRPFKASPNRLQKHIHSPIGHFFRPPNGIITVIINKKQN